MLAAELKGRIPSELQNYEDILTSSVIGLFQYLSSPVYFQSVLESCVNVNGTAFQLDSQVSECRFVFWPKLECSEPDVLLHLTDEKGKEYLICIEAKFGRINRAKRMKQLIISIGKMPNVTSLHVK